MLIDADRLRATLQRELESLRRARDELRPQAALATLEFRSEWARLDGHLERARDEIERLGVGRDEAAAEIEGSSRRLLDEVRRGYERFRHRM